MRNVSANFIKSWGIRVVLGVIAAVTAAVAGWFAFDHDEMGRRLSWLMTTVAFLIVVAYGGEWARRIRHDG